MTAGDSTDSGDSFLSQQGKNSWESWKRRYFFSIQGCKKESPESPESPREFRLGFLCEAK